MFSRFIIFFIFFLSLTRANAISLPSWYEEGRNNNRLYIYSTGSGLTVEKAVESAFHNIKNEFMIKNDNEKDIYEITKDNAVADDYSKSGLNINLLNFSNYKLEKMEQIDGYYYVLINIKRNELFNLQRQQLDEIVMTLNKLYLSLSKKNDFAKINKFSYIYGLINEIRDKVKIIKLIGNFNGTRYLELCKKIEKEYKKVLENLDIKIFFEKQDLVPLLNAISNNVARNNYIKVNDRSKNILYISYTTEKIKVNNYYNIDMLFYMKVVDKNNNLVNYNSFNYKSTSTEGFDGAIYSAIEHFKNDLYENKISINFLDYKDI